MESYDSYSSTYALKLCDKLYTLANLPSVESRVKYDKVLNDIVSNKSKNRLSPVLSGRDKFLHEKYNLGTHMHKSTNLIEHADTKSPTHNTILINIYDFLFSVFIIVLASYVVKLLFTR